MNIFKPTIKKLIAQLILVIPFGRTLDGFRYTDKPFLTPMGCDYCWSNTGNNFIYNNLPYNSKTKK